MSSVFPVPNGLIGQQFHRFDDPDFEVFGDLKGLFVGCFIQGGEQGVGLAHQKFVAQQHVQQGQGAVGFEAGLGEEVFELKAEVGSLVPLGVVDEVELRPGEQQHVLWPLGLRQQQQLREGLVDGLGLDAHPVFAKPEDVLPLGHAVGLPENAVGVLFFARQLEHGLHLHQE